MHFMGNQTKKGIRRMEYQFGPRSFQAGSRYLTLELPDSRLDYDKPARLRDRLVEDGFLFIRNFHDPAMVLAARRDILKKLAAEDKLDPQCELMDGVVNPSHCGETATVRGREHLKTESLKQVVYGQRTMEFFDRLFGEKSLSLKFQWLRTAGHGAASSAHCDVVYMGRGTRELYTLWTPFGDISPEMGPLAICLGSHRWRQVIETYGQDDVDRDRTTGVFSHDPAELVERFGGRWATASFESGDAVIISMYLMHASLTNTTNRYRISCDTRYQRASGKVDERWSGTAPMGHPVMWAADAQLESVEASRQRWGV